MNKVLNAILFFLLMLLVVTSPLPLQPPAAGAPMLSLDNLFGDEDYS